MCLRQKKARELSEETGCPASECRRALELCGDKDAAYYFLKLTEQAVVRYKQTSNGSRKWNLQDYIDEAFRLSKEDTCP